MTRLQSVRENWNAVTESSHAEVALDVAKDAFSQNRNAALSDVRVRYTQIRHRFVLDSRSDFTSVGT